MLGLSKPVTDEELQEWQHLVYDSCSLCGRCSMVCPVGNDITGMIRKMREGMSASGNAPEGLIGASTRAIEIGSPMGVKLPALQAQIKHAGGGYGYRDSDGPRRCGVFGVAVIDGNHELP